MRYLTSESLDNLRVPKIGMFNPEEEAKHVFKFMKAANSQETIWSRSIVFPKGSFEGYRLIPVSSLHLNDSEAINSLMEWRNENYKIFSPQKISTIESTSNWLDLLINQNENRILFFVVDKFGKKIGHLGIWLRDNGSFELDNVIKSLECSISGVFSQAVIALANWIRESIGIQELELRVLQTNTHAFDFYQKLGFQEISRQPLKSDLTDLGNILIETNKDDADDAWITMRVNLENYDLIDDHVLTAGPSIGAFEVSLVSEAVRTGWNSHHSDYLNVFTSEFAKYVGAEFAIATDSCTSALHLAMWSLGIGPGDEVIVPEVTWVATANAVRYVGATPVFADIDPASWCIDPTSVEKLITNRTKAIIPVHLYGFVADLAPLQQICLKYDLKLVQDAAPGIGSTYFGKGVATIGEFTCFSFQGAKLLVSGEGGVLTTNDPKLYARAFKISDSGRRPGTFWIESIGKKMKMSNITAALALSQLQSVERQICKKRQIRDWYGDNLSEISEITFQKEIANSRSICWMTSIHINREGFDRELFRERLLNLGIESRPVFPPISRYPIWEKSVEPQKSAAYIGDNAINLPSGVALSRATVDKVSSAIIKLLE